MSDLLAIGRSGVIAYRAALSTVGENVSNAETEGYTRRTVNFGESAVSTSNNFQYRSSAVFGGVTVNGIQRVFDNYRSSYVRFSNSEASRAEAKTSWLETAEAALDDSDIGLGTKMSSVFTSAEALSADVSSDTSRRGVLSALENTTNQFSATASALNSAAEGVSTTAQNTVTKLNADLKTLSRVNTGLRRANAGSAGQALLMDQRDTLLKNISDAIGIDVRLENDGRAEIRLLGDSSAVMLDSGNPNAGFVGLVQASDGRLSLALSGLGPQMVVAPQSGALAGLIDAANTIASRREALDALAANFAGVINNWNQAGIDGNGAAGAALVNGTTASTLAVATSDPLKVAAASTSGIVNANALELKNTRNSNGPEARWALIVSSHAQGVAAAKAEEAATAGQRDGAFQQLDEITGVDLDVEAAQLLRFQQAYSGSTRIIQVARETLQEIMALFK